MTKLTSIQAKADAGDPAAQIQLAHALWVGRELPRDLKAAMQYVEAACAQNYPVALRVHATLAALGFGRPRSLSAAIDLLARAADLGDAEAQGQLAALGGVDGFDPSTWFAPIQPEQKFDAPRLFVMRDFLQRPACAWLVARSRAQLAPAVVLDAGAGRQIRSEARTNSTAVYNKLEPDLVLQLMQLRIAAATGIPFMHQEATNVLCYRIGQEFKPHTDFIGGEGAGAFLDELNTIGQRVGTLLIYLNDDYEGGETDFPLLNWRFRGRPGDAILFWNVAASGALEMNSRHAGLPVAKGEKWLVSKWMRARPVPLS